MNRSQPSRRHSARTLRVPLFAVAFLAAACCGQSAWCNPELEAAIEKAEESLYEGRFNTALEQYRNLLKTLSSLKTPTQDKLALMPEIDLALRRAAALSRQLGRSADVAPLFSALSRQLAELSPTISALASYQAGWAADRQPTRTTIGVHSDCWATGESWAPSITKEEPAS